MLSLLKEIREWFDLISKSRDQSGKQLQEASSILQEAITETQIYLGKLDRRQGRDFQIESNLARLWGKTARIIREISKKDKGIAFSHRCYVISKYWAKPTFSPENNMERLEILTDDIFKTKILFNEWSGMCPELCRAAGQRWNDIEKEQELVLGLSSSGYIRLIIYLENFINREQLMGRKLQERQKYVVPEHRIDKSFLLQNMDSKRSWKQDIQGFLIYHEESPVSINEIQSAFPLTIEAIEMLMNEMENDNIVLSLNLNGTNHYRLKEG